MSPRKKAPELTFQQHIANFLIRAHRYGVFDQTDITDTEHLIAEDQLWAFLNATAAERGDAGSETIFSARVADETRPGKANYVGKSIRNQIPFLSITAGITQIEQGRGFLEAAAFVRPLVSHWRAKPKKGAGRLINWAFVPGPVQAGQIACVQG